MKQIGVVFLTKKLTTKKGHAYYSGKTEGAEGFNLMAFIRESKTGSKYLSLVQMDAKPEKKEEPVAVGEVLDNTESIIDPDSLPF